MNFNVFGIFWYGRIGAAESNILHCKQLVRWWTSYACDHVIKSQKFVKSETKFMLLDHLDLELEWYCLLEVMVYHTDLGGSAVLSIFQPALVMYMLPTSTNSATKTHFWFIQHFCRDLRPWALVRLAHGSKLISKSRLLVEWTDKWQVPSCYGTSVPSAFFSLVLRSSPIMPAKLDTKKSCSSFPCMRICGKSERKYATWPTALPCGAD